MTDQTLREMLARSLAWGDAHATFEAIVKDVPVESRGVRPAGLPHSAWELLEHLRIAQRDILDFCRDPAYQAPKWPDDYWPPSAAPPSDAAWDASVQAFVEDRRALMSLATDPAVDLGATIPHGSGQTYLRELLVIIDHNAHHLGQIVLVRRLLGTWRP